MRRYRYIIKELRPALRKLLAGADTCLHHYSVLMLMLNQSQDFINKSAFQPLGAAR